MAVEILMPSLGMYTIEGELTRWLVPEGTQVEQGQPVLELTTEKTTVEINAPAAGILHQVLPEGRQTQVQGLLGYILAPGESPPAAAGAAVPAADASASPAPSPTTAPAASAAVLQQGAAQAESSRDPRERLRVSPVARRRAEELGLDLTRIKGTGPGGRITEADVETAAASGRRVLRRLPLSGLRGVIAAKMKQSLAATAQLTLTREVDAGPLIQARKALEARGKAEGVKVPFDVLLAKALAIALREKPELNAVIENEQIVILEEVHVGIAVAVGSGLIVPVLRKAAGQPLLDLCREFADLVERARQGRLQPADYEGGTVTITNLGLYNIDAFTPILNPPESAILGVGRIAPRPFVAEDGELGVRPTVHLSLTFDHRVADGVSAASLLEAAVTQWPRLAMEQ